MTNWEKVAGELLKESAANAEFSSQSISVGFKRLSDEATIPTKAHPTDSGFDLYASEDVIIEPGETAVVPTGIAVQLPEGYEATVRPRCGATSRMKLCVQLMTIDRRYYGEIGVNVDNIASEGYSVNGVIYLLGIIKKGTRITQQVVQALPEVTAVETDDF